MDKNRKSEKDEPSKTDKSPLNNKDNSATIPNIGSLTASLDTLKEIAEKSLERGEGEVVPIPKDEEGQSDLSAGSAKELIDELNHKYARPTESSPHPARENTASQTSPASKKQSNSELETPGVVALLGALKSDLDSLRVDNEEFKTQLIGSSSSKGQKTGENLGDVRSLLESLQADIGELRQENDLLRTQTLKFQGKASRTDEEEAKLLGILSELKQDIVTLRSENDDLRKGLMVGTSPDTLDKTGHAAGVMRALKADIGKLKRDNDSLRLEELTARDGAHFKNLGGQKETYKKAENNRFKDIAKELGVVALIAGAAGGGYYFALMQGNQTNKSLSSQKTPALTKPVIKPAAFTDKIKTVKTPPVTMTPETTAPVAQNKTPQNKLKAPTIQPAVEAAMISKADGLLDTHDLGAARMVFVYLARHGSAQAMTRLAQTYDPQYLQLNRFDALKNGDLIRAKKLYGVAVSMGDELATARLSEMQ